MADARFAAHPNLTNCQHPWHTEALKALAFKYSNSTEPWENGGPTYPVATGFEHGSWAHPCPHAWQSARFYTAFHAGYFVDCLNLRKFRVGMEHFEDMLDA